MTHEMNRETLQQRILNAPVSTFISLADMMKSGAITTAAIVFLILYSKLRGNEFFEHMVYFFSAFFVSVIPFATYRFGILLGTTSMGYLDYFGPLLMAFSEIAMFALLTDRNFWNYDYRVAWFAAVGLHAFGALLVTTNRYLRTTIKSYGPDLGKIPKDYKRWVLSTVIGSLLFSATAWYVVFTQEQRQYQDFSVSLRDVFPSAASLVPRIAEAQFDGLMLWAIAFAIASIGICMTAIAYHNKLVREVFNN
jgi:hypothetical protein